MSRQKPVLVQHINKSFEPPRNKAACVDVSLELVAQALGFPPGTIIDNAATNTFFRHDALYHELPHDVIRLFVRHHSLSELQWGENYPLLTPIIVKDGEPPSVAPWLTFYWTAEDYQRADTKAA